MNSGMSAPHFQRIKQHFIDQSLTHTDEWLIECIQWAKENYPMLKTEAEMRGQVFAQWIEANLEDMQSSCLPANLADKKCYNLTGRYGLQMKSVLDIGESAYSQWNRLKKLENENAGVSASKDTDNPWNPKPRRCLYLTLTDGTQQVYGLELSPIHGLSLSLKPGVKMVINGPVECRRGVMQLKPNSVKVVGGEVESLFEANSVESILRGILHNPPENTNPTPPAPVYHSNTGTTSTNNVPDDPFGDDDDFFMDIDEETLLQTATASTIPNNNSAVGNSFAIANAETQLIDISDDNDAPIISNIQRKSLRNATTATTTPNPSIPATATATNSNTSISMPIRMAMRSSISSSMAQRNDPPSSSTTRRTAGQSVTNTNNSNNVAVAGSSRSASTRSAATASSKKSKQLKIVGYMKPVPVFIKPKTPVRPSTNANPENEDENEPSDNNINNDSSIMFASDDDDQMFMDIVIDNSVEAELAKEKEGIPTVHDPPPPLSVRTSLGRKSTGIVLPIINSPPTLPIKVSCKPFIYLQPLIENADRLLDSIDTFHVKACVATIVSSIKVVNGSWDLTVSINDGTGFLNCKLAPELLDRIIGFDPIEMKRLKNVKTMENKEIVVQGLKKLTDTLVHLNAIMEIQMKSGPEIIGFSDVMMHHISAAKQRVSML